MPVRIAGIRIYCILSGTSIQQIMTLTCAIIDDEPLAISLLESYVNKTPFLRLTAKFNSALEALPVLSAQPVELLFLDIQMPELSGMEFSRILEADTRIIFTTAFEQYALDSYKVNALDYLLKPISLPRISSRQAEQWRCNGTSICKRLRQRSSRSSSRLSISRYRSNCAKYSISKG